MIGYNFVDLRVATGGGSIVLGDILAFKSAGITHVVDCQDLEDDGDDMEKVGIEYLFNPTADDGGKKDKAWFKKSIEFALPALAKPGTKVLFHCAAGVNRGPSTCYAVLRALGLESIIARTMIVTARPATLLGLRYAADADEAVHLLGYI